MRYCVTAVLPGNCMFQKFLVGLLLLLLSLPLSAAYITDKLVAGIYAKPEASSVPLELLPSGTPVELLKTEGTFTQVRLPSRSEGWVESHFISDEKPAQVMLLELQAVAGGLRHKLQQAETALDQSKLTEAEKKVKGSAQAFGDAEAKPANKESSSALSFWLLPVAGLLFLLGFGCGILFLNFRLSKRFGGHNI